MVGAAKPQILGAGMGGNILSLVGMLITVILVLVLAYWCTKLIGRRGLPGWAAGTGGGERAQILWQISLGKSERLVLIRMNQRCLLLGVTSGGINVLTELTDEEAADWLQKKGDPPQAPSFLEILRENLPKRK